MLGNLLDIDERDIYIFAHTRNHFIHFINRLQSMGMIKKIPTHVQGPSNISWLFKRSKIFVIALEGWTSNESFRDHDIDELRNVIAFRKIKSITISDGISKEELIKEIQNANA